MRRISLFHVVVLQRTLRKCTKIYNARAQPFCCSLNLLSGERYSLFLIEFFYFDTERRQGKYCDLRNTGDSASINIAFEYTASGILQTVYRE